jgi:hypothetical protein
MKRKIVEVDLPKNGKVYFAFPTTAMLSIDAEVIVRIEEAGPRRESLLKAAIVADCLVDANGKQRFDGYDKLLRGIESAHYKEISDKLGEVFIDELPPESVDPIKNSESIPDSSQPSTSLES